MAEAKISSVADYLAQVNRVLSTQSARIKGEVSGEVRFSPSAAYFTLKDNEAQAQLHCLIWLGDYEINGVKLKEGDEVIVTGTPDIYPAYGLFKFKAATVEYAGEGALKQAYEKLKTSLAAEGLFDPANKRPLQAFPSKIGVITSLGGVVLHDFSANLKSHGYKIMTVDSRVEGKDAVHELLSAIKIMSRQDIEVLVIMRGGGSWESLQAFNTEAVVRAVANFKVPVITGIGHDVDVTLTQLAADVGESTPTAAAKILNEPWERLENSLALLERHTIGRFSASLTGQINYIGDLTHGLFRNFERQLSTSRSDIHQASNRLAYIFATLAKRVNTANNALLRAAGIMRSNLHQKRRRLDEISGRLQQQIWSRLSLASQSINSFEKTIASNDPHRNMRLGYSLSFVNGKLLRSSKDLAAGQKVNTKLVDGEFTSEIKEVK